MRHGLGNGTPHVGAVCVSHTRVGVVGVDGCRQVNIVQELYGEVFALELLVQAQLLAVKDKGFRSAMAQCVRRYMTSEVRAELTGLHLVHCR